MGDDHSRDIPVPEADDRREVRDRLEVDQLRTDQPARSGHLGDPFCADLEQKDGARRASSLDTGA